VIEAASAIQQTLARWAHGIGALPLLGALAVLVGGAALLGRRKATRPRSPELAAPRQRHAPDQPHERADDPAQQQG
jgi:hypothetical protein